MITSVEELIAGYRDITEDDASLASKLDELSDDELIDIYRQSINDHAYYGALNASKRDELILVLFDHIVANHGVEYSELDFSNEDAPVAVLYSNSGDTYNPTLMFIITHQFNAGIVGYLTYSTLGDELEQWL